MKESGNLSTGGKTAAQHRRLSSASHARRAGTRERSSRYHGYLLRSPIRKNRPLRLSLLRISAGISPLVFSASLFFDNSPLPARYQNKYDNSPAKLDSLQVLVEGHRFFRFRFASQLAGTRRFFRFSLSLVETHHFLIICRKILFLNKKSTEFLQWTMLIIILYL